MTISVKCLTPQMNVQLARGSLSICSITKIYAAARAMELANVSQVSCLDFLPPADKNTGRMFYISNICSYRISNGTEWTDNFGPNKQEIKGAVYTWGANTQGVLGNNTTTSRSSPGTIIGENNSWYEISAGLHVTALKCDGTIWSWGCNADGRLGDNTTTNRSSPVSLSGGINNWVTLSNNNDHTLAIRQDTSLWSWGLNNSGQLGANNTTNRSSPGTVVGGNNWCQISAGRSHSLALKTDGTLWAWGCNSSGELGNNSTSNQSSPVIVPTNGGAIWFQISAGACFSGAIKADGTLWTWGNGSLGKLGDNSVASKSNPVNISGGGNNWCSIKAGLNHTLALKTNGELWSWGSNDAGQLGDGTVTNRSSPVTIAGGGTSWCSISASQHSAAIKTNGTLWLWGCNNNGQLGDETTGNRSSPVSTLLSNFNWTDVAVYTGFSVGIQRT